MSGNRLEKAYRMEVAFRAPPSKLKERRRLNQSGGHHPGCRVDSPEDPVVSIKEERERIGSILEEEHRKYVYKYCLV